tara:strand:- start:948 stop:1856 length:909 start_codon:yes stop_codon:yes gene_type:complete
LPESYEIPDDTKVLIATPNFTNTFHATVHTNHVECADVWSKGGIDYNWTIVGRSFVHFARTQLCQVAVEGGFTHIFWLDDDAIIDPNILPRFIAHDKDVMIAPYCMRKMPHEIGVLKATSGDFHDMESYVNLDVEDMNQGLIQVDGGGTHAMLIKVETLTRKGESTDDNVLPPQLYEAFNKLDKSERLLAKQFLGDPPKGNQSFQEEDKSGVPYFVMPKSGTEDMYWCYRAKRKGIEIWCDTDVFSGHMGFVPVVTKAWREHAKAELTHTDETQRKYLQIIPGDTDARNPYAVVKDKAANLV